MFGGCASRQKGLGTDGGRGADSRSTFAYMPSDPSVWVGDDAQAATSGVKGAPVPASFASSNSVPWVCGQSQNFRGAAVEG